MYVYCRVMQSPEFFYGSCAWLTAVEVSSLVALHSNARNATFTPRKLSLASDLRQGCWSLGKLWPIAANRPRLRRTLRCSSQFRRSLPQTLRPPQQLVYSFASSSVSIAPSSQLPCLLPSHTHTVTMLATSRTALLQAATKQFTVKAGARAASAWSSVPQGPPVSQLHRKQRVELR